MNQWLINERKRWGATSAIARRDPIDWWLRSPYAPKGRSTRIAEFSTRARSHAGWEPLIGRWAATGCGGHVLVFFCVEALTCKESQVMAGMRLLAALERNKRLGILSAAADVLQELAPVMDAFRVAGEPRPDLRPHAEFLLQLEAGCRNDVRAARGGPLLRAGAPLSAILHAPLLALQEYLEAKTGQKRHSLVLEILSFLDLKDTTKAGLQQDTRTQRRALGNDNRASRANPLLILDPA